MHTYVVPLFLDLYSRFARDPHTREAIHESLRGNYREALHLYETALDSNDEV